MSDKPPAQAALLRLQRVLVARAGEHAETVMPGFTHLQVAQPVTLGHHLICGDDTMFTASRSAAEAETLASRLRAAVGV